MDDKFILITGATDGIGLRSAVEFAKLEKNLIIHGRNREKLEEAKQYLAETNPRIKVKTILADFEDLKQTQEAFSKVEENINCLINNAGCFSKGLILTKDGFEKTYQVNHLAHFLVTHLLLENLITNAPSKIIIVSSMAHASSLDFSKIEKNQFSSGYEVYSVSKLCNILFTFKLARMLKDKNVSVNCLHPGVINTKLLIEGWGACGSDVANSYKMILFAYNLDPSITGQYLRDLKISKATEFAYDTHNQNKCYEITKKQLEQFNLTIKT